MGARWAGSKLKIAQQKRVQIDEIMALDSDFVHAAPATLNGVVVSTQLFLEFSPQTLGEVNPIWRAQIFQMGLV